MKKVPEKFVKKGFKHTQIKREGCVALYKRSMVDSTRDITHYEVVIITPHNGVTIEGNYIEPGELYPSSSQWGEKGWTQSTIEDAEKKFNVVKKRVAAATKRKEAKIKNK
jgi:hypothetical protein